MQYIKTKNLTQKKQVLCGLRGIFLLFSCQTPAERKPWADRYDWEVYGRPDLYNADEGNCADPECGKSAEKRWEGKQRCRCHHPSYAFAGSDENGIKEGVYVSVLFIGDMEVKRKSLWNSQKKDKIIKHQKKKEKCQRLLDTYSCSLLIDFTPTFLI